MVSTLAQNLAVSCSVQERWINLGNVSFAMSLSSELDLSAFLPDCIDTTATATREDIANGWAALLAKTTCPISRLLNTKVSMTPGHI